MKCDKYKRESCVIYISREHEKLCPKCKDKSK